MVYIKIDKEFADGNFNFLERYLKILDAELLEITTSIKKSHDPDSDGLCDYGEYIIGHGFLAVQIYLNNTWPLSDVNKDSALFQTPPYLDDVSFVSIVNAAANYFKHEGEWWDKNISEKTIKHSAKTIDRIEAIVCEKYYVLSNLLAALLNVPDDLNEIKLSKLLPSLVKWRQNLSLSLREGGADEAIQNS